MKTKSILLAALVVSTLVLTSCKKDKENPTITVTEPTEHSTHKWGAEVHIHADFEDDRGLKSYEVMVGDEAGTHDHMFDWHKMGTAEGVSHHFHEHFMVPDSAMSMRWVHFTVTDAEDKVTTKSWMLHFEE